jgi:ABC-2 type transport system permease protein
MFAIFKKEINSFFTSSIGYLVIAIFLILNGLFLWVFEGEFNILNSGFADLNYFFSLAPWVLLFLVPAVCMKSFSEERKQGTLELLLTKPISITKLVFAKFLAAFVLIFTAIIPTIIYVYSIWELASPIASIDLGSIIGSYIGLLFLVFAHTSIGIFTSTLSENQIVAFIIAVFISFFFYFGFEGIASFQFFGNADLLIENLGMQSHFNSMSLGIIDTHDVIYFCCLTAIFVVLTVWKLSQKFIIKRSIFYFFALFGLYFISTQLSQRFDLTEDKRYSLSDATLKMVNEIGSPIFVDVLLEGEFPAEFKRLQLETKQLLEEFYAENTNIKFNFINPFEEEENREAITQQLVEMGLTPANITISENGKTSQEMVVPWAIANYQERTVRIPLLKSKLGENQEERITNSIQQLEYAFADGFSKLINPKKRKIAVIKGKGEPEDKYLADFLGALKEYYYIAPFSLDSLKNNSKKTLENILRFDLAIIVQPTEAFKENEKQILDQFIMNGGSSLWLLDMVDIAQDSLMQAGNTLALPRDLNLTDMLFNYGIRVNPVLANDLYSAPITLATGSGSDAQFVPMRWYYSPLATAANNHPIVNNINLVKFDFANQLDTISNDISKTILLHSSTASKVMGTPIEISLDLVKEEPNLSSYTKGHIPLAVLLEGNFTSAYKNRVKPFELEAFQEQGLPSKMIVVSDGDIIKNQLQQGRPLALGFDKWTGQQYGNKEFLLNAVNYLLNDDGLINIRSKEIKLVFINQEKLAKSRVYWQILNVLGPLVVLSMFGLGFNYFRRKKYAQKC